nr:acyltransferase [Cryobacterium sp. Hh38]
MLRAIAALAVVIYHVQHMLASSPAQAESISKLGAAGVDLFFVISGFIMMYVSFNLFETKGAGLAFLKNRFVRIAPTYYLFTTLTIAILLFFPSLYGQLRFSLTQAISSYLFLFSRNNVGEIGMVVGVGWTLAFEAFFYLLFAVLLMLPRNWCLPALATLFSAGFISGQIWDIDAAWAMVITNPLTFEFLFGCLIGLAFRKGFQISRWKSTAVIVGGVLALLITAQLDLFDGDFGELRFLVFGVPAAAIVIGAVSLERSLGRLPLPRILKRIGDSSYSMYLGHQYVLAAIAAVIVPRMWDGYVILVAVATLSVVLCVVAGVCCFLLFERPVTQVLRRRWLRHPKISATQVQRDLV